MSRFPRFRKLSPPSCNKSPDPKKVQLLAFHFVSSESQFSLFPLSRAPVLLQTITKNSKTTILPRCCVTRRYPAILPSCTITRRYPIQSFQTVVQVSHSLWKLLDFFAEPICEGPKYFWSLGEEVRFLPNSGLGFRF